MTSSTRILALLAPGSVGAYGVVRLLGMRDGHYGPGWDWQLAHASGLLGMLLFIPAVLGLGRLLPRSATRTATLTVTLLGLGASIVQFGADIVEAAMAADKAELKSLSRGFSTLPGVELAFYQVGPQLFFVGLVVLTALLARARRLPWWSAALMLVGVLTPLATLDLIPVAALCMIAALAPLRSADARSVEVA